MVSKNNQQWKQQQEAQRVPHYGLRKLSVGVASVLLSTTLYMGVTASADTVDQPMEMTDKTSQPGTTAPSTSQPGMVNTELVASDQPNATSAVSAPSSPTQDHGSQTPTSATADKQVVQTNATSTGDDPEPTSLSAADNTTPASANITQPSVVKHPALRATTQAATEPVDLSKWTYNVDSAGDVHVTAYNGDVTQPIYIPNDYDFVQAGKITAGHQALILRYTMNKLANSGTTALYVSKNGNGKLTAEDSSWNSVFDGSQSNNIGRVLQTMDLSNLDTHNVTDMSYMFNGAKSLTNIGDLSNWDTSKVTNMNGMFLIVTSLTNIGDLSNWDTHNVTDMSYMFYGAKSLTNIGDLSNWDTHNVTDMSYMFNGATSLTNIGDLSNWDTHNVTGMSYMFNDAKSLANIGDLSNWDTSKVTKMNSMFSGASSLTNIGDLSNWDTHNVTDMGFMFYGAKSLTSIGDLSNWDTHNVTSMSYMFNSAKSLTNIGDLSNWDTSKVTKMNGMFSGATSLTNIGNLSNWNTHNVTDMSSMFNNAKSFTNIGDLSNWDTHNVTNMSSMFSGASSLTNIGDLSNWDTHNVTNMSSMFSSASSLTNIGDLSNWDASKVTKMNRMFINASSLTNIGDLSNWDTHNVTDMSFMFYGASSLTNIGDLSNWIVVNVKNSGSFMDHFGESALVNQSLPAFTNVSLLPIEASGRGVYDARSITSASNTKARDYYTDHIVLTLDPTLLDHSAINNLNSEINQITINGQKVTLPVFYKDYQDLHDTAQKAINDYADQLHQKGQTVKKVPTVADYSTSPRTDWLNYFTDYTIEATSQVAINYVDDDDNQKVIKTDVLTGKTGETQQINIAVPDNYVLMDSSANPSEYTFLASDNKPITIHLKHQRNTTQEGKAVTRTIEVTMPTGKTNTIKQIVKLTRTATVDEVTGNVTYGDWSTDEWAKYDVPTIDDYEPSRATVEAAKVDANTPDQSVTITYKQIAHPSVETATKTLTEHFIYGEGDRQGKVAAPDSQIKLFFKRTNQVTADGTVVSYGQWELDPSQGTNGYQILSGQWQIPTPGNYDVLRAVAELPNGKKLSVDENREYHYSSSLAWLNPELSAVDYFADPDFYDVRTEHTTYVQAVHVDLVLRDQDPMNVGNPYVGRIHLTGFADDSRNLTWDEIVAAGKHDKVDLANYELVPGQTVTVDFEPQSPDSILVNLRHKHHQVQTVDHVKTILAPALISNLHGYTAEMWLTLNSQIDQDGRPKKDSYHQVTVAVPVTLTVDAVTQWILNAKVTPTTVNIQESQYADSDLNGHDYGIASTDDSGEFPFGPDWRQVLAKLSNGHREQLAKLLGVSNDQTLDEAISNSTVETAHFSYPKRNMNGNVQQAVTKNQIVIDGDVVSFPAFSDNGPIDHAARLYDENNPLTDEVMSFQILNWHFPKPVTRTINMHLPSGKVETTTQVVDAGKTVAFNDEGSLTLEPTHGPLEWANYEVSTQAGYTPSQAEVAAQLVDDQTADQTVDIYYTPNQHQINVEYVDDDDHGKVVKTDQVSGKTDQTITVTPSTPASYDLVDDNNRTYTVTSADGQTVQIHVKHHQVTMTEDKTVTRAINVHTPHDGVKAIKQTAELTREVTTDQVTGEKTYDDWTTGQWESYTPEVVPGYTPSTNEVPNANVDGSTGDQMVDVTYIADTQKVEIVYLDDTKDGAVVKTDQVTGKTDETVEVTPDVPAGYELVGKVPGDYTMTADGHQTITVHLVHQTKTTSESKTITRTINVHTPHDGTKVVKQVASLNRDVTTDQVTGEKTYGDWSTAEWDHYAVPAVAGYVPSIEQVAQQVVNGTTTDQTIDVTYSSGEHTTHVNYVDGDGNTVHTTTITGQTDGTVQVPNETPAGWTVVGEPVPNELTFGPDGHTNVTVTVDHQHVTVTPDQPKTPTDKLPDDPAKTYPNGVGHDDLNKSITRTLKITTPDGQTKTVEQTAHLTRTADVDEVTGEVTYGKWTTGTWSSYTVPSVVGYTPSQAVVAEVTVDADTTNQTVKITYTADSHTTHINYVAKDGKVVHTTTVTGQTDQTVKVPNETPAGWTITGDQVPSEVTFGANGHGDVTVTITHQTVTVTPDKPQTDGTQLPDNPTLTFHGVDKGDLNRTVTRIITLNVPGQAPQVITQTIRLTRTATVDEVTGKVTYGDWSTGQWDAYEVPTVDGYTADQTTIPAVNVTSETTSQAIVIDYVAVPTVPTTPSNHQTDANQVTAATPNTPLQTPVTQAQKLPQTGETQNVLAPIGLALLGILSGFSLFTKKRKAGKDDKHQS